MFILYLTSRIDKVEGVFIFLIIISVLHSFEILNVPILIYKILMLRYLPFFMAGICFYKIINKDSILVSVGILLLSLISTIAIYSLKHFIIFSIFYGVFYLALSGRMKFLSFKPLVFMGSISYSLYLIHSNIGFVIINKFYEMQWNPLLAILSSVFTSILLATIISKYIEMPLLKYIRTYYKENKNTSTTTTQSDNIQQ